MKIYHWIKGVIAASRSGAVALSAILLVSFLFLEIVAAGLVVAYFSSQHGVGQIAATRAYAAARSGIADAVLRLDRDPSWRVSTSTPHVFSVDGSSVRVSVVDSGNAVVVSSMGTASTWQVKLVATTTVDPSSGLVFLSSVSEVPVNN